MKKFAIIIAICVLALGLAACGKESSKTAEKVSKSTTTEKESKDKTYEAIYNKYDKEMTKLSEKLIKEFKEEAAGIKKL